MQPIKAAQGRQSPVDRCDLRLGLELCGEKGLDVGAFGRQQTLIRVALEPRRPGGEIAPVAREARCGEPVLQPDLVAERVDQLNGGTHRATARSDSLRASAASA